MKAFVNARVLIDDALRDDVVVTFGERIEAFEALAAADLQVIDLAGHYLFPGFVDIHVHGAGGGDIMDAAPQALEAISRTLAKAGVTRFLATTMTMPLAQIRAALENVKQVIAKGNLSGAQPLGVHLEGPYISAQFCGAQDGAQIRHPQWSDIADYLDIIKIITLAVEEDQDFKFIRHNPGVKLSIGHSAATFEQALQAYDLGVKHCTHCCNAMSGLHHRAPGVVGAVFSRPYATEIIADGVHLHPQLLPILLKNVGLDNAILISDGMRATGMPPGQYDLGGQTVFVDARSARLACGQLAGSTLTLDRAVRNVLSYTDCSLVDAVNMASRNAAKSIDAHQYGAIKVGAVADFVVMDEALNVVSTWVAGKCVYQRASEGER